MIPYFVVLLPIFAVLAVSLDFPLWRQKRIGIYSVYILTMFAALRGYVGTDTYAYHTVFRDNLGGDWVDAFKEYEPTFAIFLKVCGAITNSSFLFISLIAIIQGIILVYIISKSKWPAGFVLIYVSMFYLSFEFNILRAGAAMLLMALAFQHSDGPRRTPFYVLGLLSVLTHYSLLIAFLPVVFAKEKGVFGKVIAIAFGLTILLVAAKALMDNGVYLDKLQGYMEFFTVGDPIGSKISIVIRIFLSAIIFACVVTRVNWVSAAAVFGVWVILRWATINYLFVDRIEIIVSFLMMVFMGEVNLLGWRRRVRHFAFLAMAGLGIFGSFRGLTSVQDSSSRGQLLDANHMNSPYLPYRFFWNE